MVRRPPFTSEYLSFRGARFSPGQRTVTAQYPCRPILRVEITGWSAANFGHSPAQHRRLGDFSHTGNCRSDLQEFVDLLGLNVDEEPGWRFFGDACQSGDSNWLGRAPQQPAPRVQVRRR